MPEMDGYEVARRIRADFPDRAAVLVALTVGDKKTIGGARKTPASTIT
jgi:CheY-like chemotaxis protein